MSGTPDKSLVAPVVMDARKFVRQINNSAAAKLRFFEESIAKMGKSVGKNLRLTSLDSSNVIYEDVDKNVYYIADLKKGKRGKVHLENVRPIQIVEEDKAVQYNKNVRELVEQICEGNLSQADRIFHKIESQRFRSKVIPSSGWITLKDGVSRHIPVSTRIVKEDHAANIVKLFSEAVKDNVEVDRGRIIRGTLSDDKDKFVIPINEYTRRRLVAYKMKEAAKNAYKSSSFQDLVTECAALVCEGEISKAIKLAAKFLKEEQEFCLLDSKEMINLVENTLATRAQFNTMLAHDVASLLHKTNLKINRESILEAWTKMAQKSEAPSLLNNVNILSESSNFERDHDRFLNIVFNEDMDIQTARAKAYRTTLRVIASILPDLEDESGEEVTASVEELNELIDRLSSPEPDTDAILQAEELLAGISDSLIDSVQDLEGFDSVPGEEEESEGESEEEGELVPLPELGGEEGEELGPEEEGGTEGIEGPESPEELGPEGGPEEEPEEEGPPPMESKHRRMLPVEKMGVSNLLEELEDWEVNGDSFLREYGYDKCYSDMKRYVKRCIELGPDADVIRESFEHMRDRLVATGSEVLPDIDDDDPYSESVMSALNGSDKLLSESGNNPEKDMHFWGDSPKLASESRINPDYRHTFLESGLSGAGLRMSDLQGSGGVVKQSPMKSDGRSGGGGEAAGFHAPQRGSGVSQKGLRPVDGRKGEKSTPGSAGGSTRMDELQGSGGVQDSSLEQSDGRSGRSRSVTQRESQGDPALSRGGYDSVGLEMGKDFQKGGVQSKSLTKGSGASGDGAKSAQKYEASGGPEKVAHQMGELQGRGGVADSPSDSYPFKGQGRVGSEGGLKKAARGGDMSDQQGSGGVAEAITPERIAAMIAEMDKCDCRCAGDPSKCECGDDCSCKESVVSEDCGCKCGCKEGKPCGPDCTCEYEESVSEEAIKGVCKGCGKPNFICRGKCGSSEFKDDDKDESSSDEGDGEQVAAEDQYKFASKKYKRGLDKSSMAESVDKVAAFVGTPDSVAAAVDKALSSMDGLDSLGVAEVTEELPDADAASPMGDDLSSPEDEEVHEPEDLEDEDSRSLEDSLDDVLTSPSDTDDVDDELDTAGGVESECVESECLDSSSKCKMCGKVVSECECE